jgi:hypothetical protein
MRSRANPTCTFPPSAQSVSTSPNRPAIALTEARDRRVIGPLVGADHARGDILNAAPLDRPRGPLADRVDVEQQRHHHRRIVRRPTMAVSAIGRIERGQIDRRDRVDHKPRKVILRQQSRQARRQQQLLLTITRQEVLRHAGIVFRRPAMSFRGGPSPLCI